MFCSLKSLIPERKKATQSQKACSNGSTLKAASSFFILFRFCGNAPHSRAVCCFLLFWDMGLAQTMFARTGFLNTIAQFPAFLVSCLIFIASGHILLSFGGLPPPSKLPFFIFCGYVWCLSWSLHPVRGYMLEMVRYVHQKITKKMMKKYSKPYQTCFAAPSRSRQRVSSLVASLFQSLHNVAKVIVCVQPRV